MSIPTHPAANTPDIGGVSLKLRGIAYEIAEGRVMDGEGRVAGDAEKGGISLFGGGLMREEVGEDDMIAILGVRGHVDNG